MSINQVQTNITDDDNVSNNSDASNDDFVGMDFKKEESVQFRFFDPLTGTSL